MKIAKKYPPPPCPKCGRMRVGDYDCNLEGGPPDPTEPREIRFCKCKKIKITKRTFKEDPFLKGIHERNESPIEKALRESIDAQVAKAPDPRPERDPEKMLVHLVEMLKNGYKDQAVTSIRMHNKTLAWAGAAVDAIEWAMKTPVLKARTR